MWKVDALQAVGVAICGKWVNCKLSESPKYAEAKRREKKGNKRNIDGAKYSAKRWRGKGGSYQQREQPSAQREISGTENTGTLSVKGRRKPRPPGNR